jgi:protein-tyrosine phosphatase
MDWILGRLACGTFDEAQMLASDGPFDVVMNLSERPSETVVHCLHAPMPDEVFLEAAVWELQVQKLFAVLMVGRRAVFVHCRLGISRSPALCAAYLMACGGARNPEEAMMLVRGARRVTHVHPETWRGLTAWWRA